jgi:hypothetical protein
MLYRCYLIRNGHIELGYDVDLERLADAIAHGHVMLTMQPQSASFGGIEIWCGESRVYGDDCYADDTGHFTPVVGPFQTGESTMFLARGLYSQWRIESTNQDDQMTTKLQNGHRRVSSVVIPA